MPIRSLKPRTTSALFAMGFIMPLANATAYADPLPADAAAATTAEVAVTATRTPTPVTETPAGVTIIDRATIEERNYTTLADALQSVPGLHMVQSGGPGGVGSVFLRGTNSDDVLVLRDGVPLNDPSDSNDQFNFGTDLIGDVERIEIVRGPMASVYGSGAVGGVINIISRQGREQGVHVDAIAGAGYPAQGGGYVTVSGVDDKFDYAVTVEGNDQRGFDSTPRRMSIFRNVPQRFRDETGTVNLGYSPVDGTRFFVFGRARESVFGYNNLGDPTFDDSNAAGTDDQFIGRVGVTSKLLSGVWETSLSYAHLTDDRRYLQNLNANDPNAATDNEHYHGNRDDIQWNNVVHLDSFVQMPAFSKTDLTFGVEQIDDHAKSSLQSSSFGFGYGSSGKASQDGTAGYLGLQTHVGDRVTLTGQVRQDAYTGIESATTYRVGTVIGIPELASNIHAAYGTAFRVPSLFDRFGVDTDGYVGNPSLRPERSQGYEIGTTTDIPAWRPDAATVAVTYFNNQVQDLIDFVYSPVYTTVNIGSAHISGVESSITVRPSNQISTTLAYTYTDARNADTNSLLLRRPYNQVSATARIQPIPNLTIAPELLWTGTTRDYLYDNNGLGAGNGINGPGFILNTTITYQITPAWSAFVNGRNITNSRYEPANGYQTPGAQVLAGIRLKL